ncbi:hypothetical protein [Stenotrophomonas maltophilia]|uniref:hypothetical protein n=1 Tax=Stenotrophomonas maltophilia TaxID=40324 RepID=UPI0034D7B6BB
MSSTLALSAMLSKLGATPADEAKVNHDPSGAGADDIRIAPVLVGSKCGGVLQTIVGVALIVVVGIPGGPGAAAGIASLWGAVGAAGWSLAIGGVAQMLSVQPRGLRTKESSENTPSYSMNGPVNGRPRATPCLSPTAATTRRARLPDPW